MTNYLIPDWMITLYSCKYALLVAMTVGSATTAVFFILGKRAIAFFRSLFWPLLISTLLIVCVSFVLFNLTNWASQAKEAEKKADKGGWSWSYQQGGK